MSEVYCLNIPTSAYAELSGKVARGAFPDSYNNGAKKTMPIVLIMYLKGKFSSGTEF